jgi:hypothetical protein
MLRALKNSAWLNMPTAFGTLSWFDNASGAKEQRLAQHAYRHWHLELLRQAQHAYRFRHLDPVEGSASLIIL